MKTEKIRESILGGKTSLGIELGSTRIKGILVDENNEVIAAGGYSWENKLENGIWTYHLNDVWTGMRECYRTLVDDVKEKYDIELTSVGAMGISGMMHGYLVFDKEGRQLADFRTWRNTVTERSAAELSELFGFNIPQRWSIAHLDRAILNGEDHIKSIDFMTTLAGYVHWMLTGEKAIGIGEASGMFPINSETHDFDETMIKKFDSRVADKNLPWKLRDILPTVHSAGDFAGKLTEEGAKLLDPYSVLPARGRCRHRHGGNEQRCTENRQCFGRNVDICNDSPRKAALKGVSRDRHGNNAGRQSRCDGTLQQLHDRSRFVDRSAQRDCGADERER